jgi:chromosome segregation ATPase
MKSIFTFLFSLLVIAAVGYSQDQEPVQISLKITYEDKPLCNWDITIKAGSAVIGKGVTDASGFIKFDPYLIVSKSINVYGYKKSANGDKNWSVEGYVTLDDAYFHHMKMEVYAKEIADGAGFPMSAIADSWGVNVNCDGTVGTNTSNTTNTTNTTTTTTTPTTTTDPDQAIKDQKLALENQLADLTKKITALESDINQNKATLTPIDLKLKELEKQELELRREECKTAIERTNKSLDKSITTDGLQSYTAKEQEFKLKADALQKQRTELSALKNQNAVYAQQVHDYPIVLTKHKTDLSGMTQLNKIDSINYKIKTLEMEETSYKFEAAKIGLDKTNKQIENALSKDTKPHADTQIQELQTKEDEYNKQASTTRVQIQEQLNFKKEAEKEAKKDANQVKIDNSKLKVKIQTLKSQLGMKEKALAKEQKKKKQDLAKIEALQKEIEQLKTEISEAEKQIKS